jgi:hypothetical protein
VNLKRSAVLLTGTVVTTKLVFRWLNRSQPYYYEYLQPSVVLVAAEELDGVEMPRKFCWMKDVNNVFFYANPELGSVLTASWRRNLRSLSVSRESTFTSNYSAAVREICSLPAGVKAIIISDAKTIARLRRTAYLWSDSPSLVNIQPIDSRTLYMAS